MAWQQASRGGLIGSLRGVNAVRYYGRAIGRLLGTVRRGRQANDGRDFSATQASVFLEGFTLRSFIEECCAEHERRMREFAPALLKPRFLPGLAAIALAGLRLGRGFRALREERV
jgi:hypothetical protein